MTPVLRAGVHAAAVGDALILLDLEEDDYLCLPGAGDAVKTGEGGALQVGDAGVAGILDAAGLLGPGPVMPGKPLPARPLVSVIYEPAGRPPRGSRRGRKAGSYRRGLMGGGVRKRKCAVRYWVRAVI